MSAEKKLVGYLCTGCGIGDRLDAKQLLSTAKREGKLQECKQHEMLCNAEGVKMIKDDITEGATHIMIAACSRRAKVEAFNFPEAAMTRANLREGVIWVRPATDENGETTQEMAEDYIRMACAELRTINKPSSSGEQSLNKNILVVGGGVTGMTASLEAAAAGYPVTLVEKSGALGGHAALLHKRVPHRAAAIGTTNSRTADLPQPVDNNVAELITRIESAGNISVQLNSTVAKTSGAPGRFSVEIATASGPTISADFGAIIQASGFKPYDAGQLGEFAYGASPDVVTNLELEQLAKEAGNGPIRRPSDGKEVQSVAFIQCAGQRSEREAHLPYCSGFCCTTSIKQAIYFKDQNPGCDATILFDDLRTPGAAGEDFYRAGQQKMVTFSKGKATEVVPGSSLLVRFQDLILNEATEITCDLVVLATGIVANSGPDPYAQLAFDEAAEGSSEKETLRKALEVAPPSILNLSYRQGTDLPHLRHGFTDSHFICFPYETRRTGIYAAGPVRRPMDIQQAMDDAAGAAMKAIQAVENAGLGRAAHPRSGDLSFPSFRKEGCTQCKRCTVECPFGAINEDDKGYPLYNEARCRRCGTCMGACPVRVISFENYSVESVNQQIKNCNIPDEFAEKPRVLVFACENDAYPALDQASMSGRELTPWARVIPVRCLGSINLSWITDSLNSGYDGVVLMGCRRDDDYQCHFVRGSAIAAERMSKVGDTLSSLNLEPERVALYEVAITDIERAPKLINDMADTIARIGQSPFKF
ncbi:MAG: hydrogenase iron-sulfur subunit [Gammaproteobacteria bacterium]|nr:hydrogenase iron-sulfur subunit [Gammaproteobacteria bacterium]MBU1656335.1 hydrogenase iron-sulfur subunit [Gammaproteobacteria bacterium]MBU1959900.1 hydrogenase iron-sulfur subunit [Gammaproteobacteria bacterium]